jgi:hypothetical protein
MARTNFISFDPNTVSKTNISGELAAQALAEGIVAIGAQAASACRPARLEVMDRYPHLAAGEISARRRVENGRVRALGVRPNQAAIGRAGGDAEH